MLIFRDWMARAIRWFEFREGLISLNHTPLWPGGFTYRGGNRSNSFRMPRG
jgi:hypothetical protein